MQGFMDCVPTLHILDSKSNIQSRILTQSASESLVDLMIDPSTPKGEIGPVPLESNLNKSPVYKAANHQDFDDPAAINMSTKATINVDDWMVPTFDGSDFETESNIPMYLIHCLNEGLSLLIGDAEDFMFQIQEVMHLYPNLQYPLFGRDTMNTEKKVPEINLFKVSR